MGTKNAITTFLPAVSPLEAAHVVTPSSVQRDDVLHMLESGAQLIDVLSPAQYQEAHLAGAMNIPLAALDHRSAALLDHAQPVIVYSSDSQCDLSARAAWRLANLGFMKVFRYKPGKADWLANGLPIEGWRSGQASAGSLARRQVLTCLSLDLSGEVLERYQPWLPPVAVVVNHEHVVLGLIAHDRLLEQPDAQADELMDTAPRTYRSDGDPIQILADMRADRLPYVLITTTGGQLIGLLDLATLEAALPAGLAGPMCIAGGAQMTTTPQRDTMQQPSEMGDRPSRAAQWFGLLAAAAALAFEAVLAFVVAPIACSLGLLQFSVLGTTGLGLLMFVLAAAAVLFGVFGGYTSYRNRMQSIRAGAGDAEQSNFLGVGGIMLSVLFVALTIISGISLLSFRPCAPV